MFAAGVTLTVAPLEIPLSVTFVVPSVYTTSYVPADNVKVNTALFPEQMVTVPLILAVGRGLTVTIALPVMLGLGADTEQLVATSVTLTIV